MAPSRSCPHCHPSQRRFCSSQTVTDRSTEESAPLQHLFSYILRKIPMSARNVSWILPSTVYTPNSSPLHFSAASTGFDPCASGYACDSLCDLLTVMKFLIANSETSRRRRTVCTSSAHSDCRHISMQVSDARSTDVYFAAEKHP